MIERELETHCITNYFKSSGLVGKVEDSSQTKGRRNGVLVPETGQQQEECRENYDDENPPKRMVIRDTDDQWELINKNEDGAG